MHLLSILTLFKTLFKTLNNNHCGSKTRAMKISELEAAVGWRLLPVGGLLGGALPLVLPDQHPLQRPVSVLCNNTRVRPWVVTSQQVHMHR